MDNLHIPQQGHKAKKMINMTKPGRGSKLGSQLNPSSWNFDQALFVRLSLTPLAF
jgi:hypothetical protein